MGRKIKRGFFGLLEDGKNNSVWMIMRIIWRRDVGEKGMNYCNYDPVYKRADGLRRRDIIDMKQVETLRSLLVSSHFSMNMKTLHEVRVRMEKMGKIEEKEDMKQSIRRVVE